MCQFYVLQQFSKNIAEKIFLLKLHTVFLVNQITGRPKNKAIYIQLKKIITMKKITFILILCAITLVAKAQVLLDETFFDFPSTDNTATVNGWTNYSGNFNGNEPNLTDYRTLDKAGLQYADLSGTSYRSEERRVGKEC